MATEQSRTGIQEIITFLQNVAIVILLNSMDN